MHIVVLHHIDNMRPTLQHLVDAGALNAVRVEVASGAAGGDDAEAHLLQLLDGRHDAVLVAFLDGDEHILEISSEFGIQTEDFIHRVEILTSLGYYLLISNFKYFYVMKHFFRKYTQSPFVVVMSARHLQSLFDPTLYKNLEGGIFEGLGKLLDDQTKLYIYPHNTSEVCLTTIIFFPRQRSIHLYRHFIESSQIMDISGCDNTENYYHSSDVKKMIESKNKLLEKLVPELAKDYIRKHKLWSE